MPNVSIGKCAAPVVAAIVGWVVGSLSMARPHPAAQEQTQADATENEAHEKRTATPGRHPIDEGWHPEEREHHRQERGYWRLTAVLTFFAVAGAIATVVMSDLSWQESRRAAVEARRQADAAEAAIRPFARVDSLQIYDIEVDERRDVTISLRGVVENQGSSGAQKVSLTSAFFLLGAIDTTKYDLGSLCEPQQPLALAGVVVMPKLKTSLRSKAIQTRSHLEKAFYHLPVGYFTRPDFETYAKSASLEVVGCLTYEDGLGKPHRASYDFVFPKADITRSSQARALIEGKPADAALNFAD